MLYKPTHPKLLPDHIEISPNIAPTRPSFNDLVSFDGIINGEWRDLRMAGNAYNKIWTSCWDIHNYSLIKFFSQYTPKQRYVATTRHRTML